MTAKLVINRPRGGWANRLRRFTLIVNGKTCATIKHGQTVELEVPAGAFSLTARIDTCTTNPEKGTIADGEVIHFSVENGATLAGQFNPSQYLHLRRLNDEQK